ncbi:MAG TPA: PQQ-binding-like beta-propeller repeat protein [Gemmataceae bacterium]|nr:PQQ-binding-like beta-propeller repeat protein [Gemmataceae bacterium]
MKPFLPLWLAACFCVTGPVHATDWYQWRGPEQKGVSLEKNLPDRWSTDPKAANNNLIWKAPYGSRSTPIVQNGRVYLINDAGEGLTEQERVMCFDANSGKVEWEYKFNVFLTDIVSDRVGWTNLVADPETGNVYAHGVQGLLFCFTRDGKVLWSHSLTEEYGRISGYGGRVVSPVVDGELVIVGMLNASWGEQARGGNRFVAFNKRTGVPVWWASTEARPKDTYYSTPIVTVIGGQRLLISGGGDGGVHAFKVRTGEKVWSYFFGSGAVNCSPVAEGNRIYIAHGDESPDSNKQGRVICLDGSKVKDGKPELIWQRDGIKVKYASPILHEGRLYVCDEVARLYCLDAATGKPLWKTPFTYGRNCMGSPVWADGKIYVGEVQSRFHILKPGPDKCERLYAQFFRGPAGDTAEIEVNGSPAVANGRIYFSTSRETYCIGKKEQPVPASASPQPVTEEPANPNAKPAHLQVLPADVVLEPGQSMQFLVRAFDDHGRFLRDVQAEWSLAGPLPPAGVTPPPGAKPATPPPLQGEISPAGKLTVAKAPPGQFGMVVAKAQGLTGQARVRVVPTLPYHPDFGRIPEGRTPGGWVNTQGKFAVQTKNGAQVLVKLANIASPLVSRAHAYIGKPTMTDYTVQADMQGSKKGEDMPDMGVLANRYTLVLDGNKQQLRLLSWDALPRVDKTISWTWKPGVWYTLKLTVDVHGNSALVRGKAWPRGEPEPAVWTIELEDPVPNREGSPGLYGYATGIVGNEPGAEVYYANVSVTPNKK